MVGSVLAQGTERERESRGNTYQNQVENQGVVHILFWSRSNFIGREKQGEHGEHELHDPGIRMFKELGSKTCLGQERAVQVRVKIRHLHLLCSVILILKDYEPFQLVCGTEPIVS